MHRDPWPGRASRWCARALLLVSTAGLLLGVPVSGAAASPSRPTGSFRFSGAVTGSLKVPAGRSDCVASGAPGGTVTMVWDHVTLGVAGLPRKFSAVHLRLDVARFGSRQSMKRIGGSAPGAVVFSPAGAAPWSSVSGTVSTSTRGASGSVTGLLTAGAHHAGTMGMEGRWSGCRATG